jgi:hypothetical protein
LIRVCRRLLNTNSAPARGSSLFQVFAQVLRDQCVQAVEPFAHVAGFHGHEHLQAARKT